MIDIFMIGYEIAIAAGLQEKRKYISFLMSTKKFFVKNQKDNDFSIYTFFKSVHKKRSKKE